MQPSGSGPAGVPKDSCIPWKGLLANVPGGYFICDGTNGTPDLREAFVRGAANGADSGATGGEDNHNHQVSAPSGGYCRQYAADGSTLITLADNNYGCESGGTQVMKGGTTAAYTKQESTLPTYYSLLYIMKG